MSRREVHTGISSRRPGRWLLVLVLFAAAAVVVVAFVPPRWWLVAGPVLGVAGGLVVGLTGRRGSGATPTVVPAPSAWVPRELPIGPHLLLGRTEQLQQASDALARPGGSGALVVRGPHGSGRSAFAVALARQVALSFPGGQILVDGTEAAADATPDDVGGTRQIGWRVLDALDPHGPATDRGGDVRKMLEAANRKRPRVLVVVDDAVDPDAVLTLFEGMADWTLLLTSAGPAPSVPGAPEVVLAPLGPADALRVFEGVVGAARVAAEPHGASQLAEAALGLPFAITAAVAAVAARPRQSLADARQRLDAFRRASPTSPHHPLDLPCALLGPAEWEALRLTALTAPPAFAPWALAALLEKDEHEAAAVLEQLVRSRLIDRGGEDLTGIRLYTVPPIVRAMMSGRIDEPAAERLRSRRALLEAETAHRLRDSPAEGDRPRAVYAFLAQGKLSEAVAFARRGVALARERHSRAEEGMSTALLAFVSLELGDFTAALDLAGTAIALTDDPRAICLAHLCRGSVHRRVHQHAEAVDDLDVVLASEQVDAFELIRALVEKALVQAQRTPTDPTARVTIASALSLCREHGERCAWLLPGIHYAASVVHECLGDRARSAGCIAEGRRVVGSQHLWSAWFDYREAQWSLGSDVPDPARAIEAVTAFGHLGHGYGQALGRVVLGEIHRRGGQLAAARRALESARAGLRASGDWYAEYAAAGGLRDLPMSDAS